METNKSIPLNITIGDRSFRIKIMPADEEKLRKTLKTINDKILDFRTNFAGKDMQDYVSMVLIWYATQLQVENNATGSEEVLQSILKMEKQLDALSSNDSAGL